MYSISLARNKSRAFLKKNVLQNTLPRNVLLNNVLKNVPNRNVIVRNMCSNSSGDDGSIADVSAQRNYYGSYIEKSLFGKSVRTYIGAFESIFSDAGTEFVKKLFDAGISEEHMSMRQRAKRATKLYIDMQNPLLQKYGFDHDGFLEGARGGMEAIKGALESKEFSEHCKGNMLKCPQADLLRATLHPSLYVPYFFGFKSFRSNMLHELRFNSVHLNRVFTTVQTIESMVSQKRLMDMSIDYHPDLTYAHYKNDSQMNRTYEKHLQSCFGVLNYLSADRFTEIMAISYIVFISTKKRKITENSPIDADDVKRYIRRSMRKLKEKIVANMFWTNEEIQFIAEEQHYSEIVRVKIIMMHNELNMREVKMSDFYDLKAEEKAMERQNREDHEYVMSEISRIRGNKSREMDGMRGEEREEREEGDDHDTEHIDTLFKDRTKNKESRTTSHSSNSDNSSDKSTEKTEKTEKTGKTGDKVTEYERIFLDKKRKEAEEIVKSEEEFAKKNKETILENNIKNGVKEKVYETILFPPYYPYPVGAVIANVDVIVSCDHGDDTRPLFLTFKFQGCISDHAELDWKVSSLRFFSRVPGR